MEYVAINEKANGSSKCNNYFDDYEAWLHYLYCLEYDYKSLGDNYVKTIQYILVVDECVVGFICTRLETNKFILKATGHIGYSIKPSERGKGYATLALRLCLREYLKLNYDKVLVSCYDDNLASAKVIENNCGILENKIDYNGKVIRRYWINL